MATVRVEPALDFQLLGPELSSGTMRTLHGLLLIASLGVVVPLVTACGDKDKGKSSKASEKDDDDDDDKGEKKSAKSVLSKIETFKAPAMAAGDLADPYDSIKQALELKEKGGNPPGADSLKPLPPTLTDTLLADLRTISFFDLGKRLDGASATEADLQKVVDFISKTEWKKIRGYRPWAHKAFFDSLSEDERKQLAKEAAEYVKKNGFKGHDNLPPGDPPAPKNLVAEAAPTASPPSAPASGTAELFAGSYSSAWGPVTLEQTQATPTVITGKYTRGTMDCTASGVKLDCTWKEGATVGLATFTRQANGDLHGTWGGKTSATSGGAWNLKLTKAGELK